MMKNINQIKNVFFFKLNIIPDQNQSQHLIGNSGLGILPSQLSAKAKK